MTKAKKRLAKGGNVNASPRKLKRTIKKVSDYYNLGKNINANTTG